MFTEPVSSWTMSLKRRASYMLLPAVIWWFGNVPLEHVSAGKVAICIQCPPVGACGPVRPIGADFPTACAAGPFVKPRRRFKWNEMANCGDSYVFFDPLGSSESVLSSNSQSFALHDRCQEVVSKGGLDRLVKPTQSSITLTVNTLGAGNKNQQLSRGSKYKPTQMFKNEGPMNPDFGEITQQLCNSQGAGGKGTIFNTRATALDYLTKDGCKL